MYLTVPNYDNISKPHPFTPGNIESIRSLISFTVRDKGKNRDDSVLLSFTLKSKTPLS